MNFAAYLESKNIDSNAFKAADPHLWAAWETEFEQVHPNSFTAQKLYLINPIRKLYQLAHVEKASVKGEIKTASTTTISTPETPKPVTAKPAIPRPAFKPKASEISPAPKEDAAIESAKPVAPKPVFPRPVVKTKPADETNTAEQNASTEEQPKPIAKPVIPRPVFKPKPKPE